jgi:hypothetical protein
MLEMINPSLKVVQLEFLGLSRENEECLTQHTFQVAKAECFMFHTKRVTKVGIEWYLFALSLSLRMRDAGLIRGPGGGTQKFMRPVIASVHG